ncbi:hypothetical protein WICPIJ_009978 [Wickerhamomyces pijperi]|uniref:Uncharacterized protein n=1 Tax=Wickerhamomyces pijperi TaxID=599730 RepID=A0A9P8PKB0_WICPI|nr:hypothetical protein WICPIJ_009978 [Wickerhamomyces pijperi]
MARKRQPSTRQPAAKRAKIGTPDSIKESVIIKQEEPVRGTNVSSSCITLGFEDELQTPINTSGPVSAVAGHTVSARSTRTRSALQQPRPQRAINTRSSSSSSPAASTITSSRSSTPPTGNLSLTGSPILSPNPPRTRRHLRPLSESEQHQQTKALLEKLRPKYTHNNYPTRPIRKLSPNATVSATAATKPKRLDQSSLMNKQHATYQPTKTSLQRDMNFVKTLSKLQNLKLCNFVNSGLSVKGDKKIDHRTLLTAINSASKYHIFKRVDIDTKTVSILRNCERWKEDKFDRDIRNVLTMDNTDKAKVDEEWRKVLGVTPVKTFKDFK